ncbi:MAG: OmpA family protein [Kineosporiaceae bacterium]
MGEPTPSGRTRPVGLPAGLLAGVLAGVLAGPPAVADATPGPGRQGPPPAVTSAAGIEVTTHGVVRARQFNRLDRPEVALAVHAVQRLDQATVVYLSIGSDEPAALTAAPLASTVVEQVGTQLGARYAGGDGLSDVRVVDSAVGEVLTVVPDPAATGALPRPFVSDRTASPTEPGMMTVVYAVLPPLDPDTETVDVQVAYGGLVTDVPVGEGLLEPAREAGAPIPVGTGWPEIDESALGEIPEPDLSRHELEVVTEDLERERTTTETPEEVTVDVAADVLFAQDSADLSPDALGVLGTVAADIDARATGGRVQVVGHTDSQASEAYNEDLSRRRAQAVATVLEGRIRSDVEFVVEGRGEGEPVATNSSPEGRQANRRVAVTFRVAGEEAP